MQRGARPARPFTHFSNSFLLFVAPPAAGPFFNPLWCFTGYYFIDEERSHAAWRSSCAAVHTFFQLVFAIFGSACLLSAGWLSRWLVGWLAGWLVGWLVGWLAGWLAGWLVGWLVGWWLVAGWLAWVR